MHNVVPNLDAAEDVVLLTHRVTNAVVHVSQVKADAHTAKQESDHVPIAGTAVVTETTTAHTADMVQASAQVAAYTGNSVSSSCENL